MRAAVLCCLVFVAFCNALEKISWKAEIVKDFEQIDLRHAFGEWKAEFKKAYATIEEEANRFATFVENWKMISKANEDQTGAILGLNQFADLTSKQFKLRIHGTEGSCLRNRRRNITYYSPSKAFAAVPNEVDWTTKGVVTPVKNQGQCGSCWAFSTTGSIESRSAIKTGKLVSLSEQQLVDCSKPEGNQGCQGGLMDDAFEYVKKAGGLCTEAQYPYKGANGVCQDAKCTKYDPITGYVDVTKDRPDDLAAAVAVGPVSVAIEANQLSFQFYRGGVMKGRCGTKLDHGVLVVGYGTDTTAGKFWKVKNSWGASWGEHGYFRVCRECNKNAGEGECGILLSASYPTV